MCLLYSFPFLALALACFSPFLLSDSWLPPLSITLIFCLLSWGGGTQLRGKPSAQVQGLWSLGCSAQLSSVRCSLPRFLSLAKAILPFALELPAP